MKKDRIRINKELIPYKFTIAITDVTFILEIRYNTEADLFVVVLYDRDGNLICTEPIIYGAELFLPQYQPRIYPSVKIVPLDESGETTAVTWDNLDETVFLIIENVGDE